MAKNYEEIVGTNAEIVALSTDDLRGAEFAVENFVAKFPIVYTDGDPEIPRQYGVFNLFGDGLASASVFVFDNSGTLVWKSVGKSYTHQVSSAKLIEVLEQIGA
ncbi:MAG: redoxin domain-containing protein [Chloroflexi bacterium]|nr:redoxin domain-containing protein [Chloroflexota bacterium]